MRARIGMKAITGKQFRHEARGKSLDNQTGQPCAEPLGRSL